MIIRPQAAKDHSYWRRQSSNARGVEPSRTTVGSRGGRMLGVRGTQLECAGLALMPLRRKVLTLLSILCYNRSEKVLGESR